MEEGASSRMLPSPKLSSRDKKERLWQINDRLADKHGYCHNVYWVSGDLYRGHWEANKRHGAGIHTYKTGNRYEGDWKNGMRDGFGTSFLIDPRTDKYRVLYKGHWKEGKKHGPGLLYGASGETYEGDFADGMRNGVGKQFYRCQRLGHGYHVYHGQWVNDRREGVGILRMLNGDIFKGSFANDVKEGKGTYFFGDRRSKYEGLWKNDVAICGTYLSIIEGDRHIPFLELHNACSFVQELVNEHLETKLISTYSFNDLPLADRMRISPRNLTNN